MAQRLEISYISQGFPLGASVVNGTRVLTTSWDELLWSALTVGRPNRQYVFRFGTASLYEALFRTSMVRMTVEQSGPMGRRLRRTTAAKTLDPSEKGAINYFLGLAICKLFASKLLTAPWMIHLDVCRPRLNPVLFGRSRPDLVGEIRGRKGWIAMECKGRVSVPDATAKKKAKQQALRLQTVNGIAPTFHLGAFAYFRSDVLEFYWEDPPNDVPVQRAIEASLDEDVWRYYYSPVLALIRSQPHYRDALTEGLVSVQALDIQIGILPEVMKLLEAEHWDRARHFAEEAANEHPESSYQLDGIRVVAGPSWLQRFDEEQS